ncbi:unnamed protein product [Blepharisma stoltei]|uniref:Uncharacterized protein n=1 Tax=Blepharisma stoltei TaxID=1481888 RepID=A0AAU9IWQ4_9CILI|nr:unnamed protein product [Blepharisma stoltei]
MAEPKFDYDKGNFFTDLWMIWAFQTINFWKKNKPSHSNILKIPDRFNFEESLLTLEKEWDTETRKPNPKFLNALVRTVWWEFTKYSFYLNIGQILGLAQAVIMIFLIDFFTDDSYTMEGIWLVACLGIAAILSVSLFALGAFYLRLLTIKIKSIVPYIVYKKVLNTSFEEISQKDYKGKLPNTIAADLEYFSGITTLGMIAGCPFIFIGAFLIIGILTGWAGIIGLAVLILHFPVAVLLSSMSSYYRMKSSTYGDRRIVMITNIIEGIRVVKLYGWEEPFLRLIYMERSKEIKEQNKEYAANSLNNSIGVSGIGIILLITFALYVHLGDSLEVSTVFCVVATMCIVYCLVTKMGVNAAYSAATIVLSMERLTQILLLSEKNSDKENPENPDFSVSVKNASFSYISKKENQETTEENPINKDNIDNDVLTDINFELKKGELLIVVGQVGSGKSSLLLGLLDELFKSNGQVKINGKASYSAQDPWILSGTIKANIIMDKEYIEELYKNVIKMCMLEIDLDNFANKDETIVGDNGITLSGGQKARISLARILYANRDVILLDDPLSAVDSEVSSFIFKNCIKDYLKNKTVILVTHQIHLISEADKLLILNQGKQIFFGTYQEFQGRADIEDFVGELKQMTDSVEKKEVDYSVYVKEIKSESISSIADEEKDLPPISLNTYHQFFIYGYKYNFVLVLVLLVLVITQIASIAVIYWLTVWSAQSDSEQEDTYYVWFYAIIVSICYFCSFLRCWILSYGMTIAGKNLHNKALESMVKTSTVFFDKNQTGRMINRFSKDTFMIDELLHGMFYYFVNQAFDIWGLLISISILIPPAAALVLIYLLVTIWFSKLIIPMVKDLGGLTLVSKSPILSLANSTLHGIVTIRSHELQQKFIYDMKVSLEYNCRCEFSRDIPFRFYQFYMEIFLVLLCIMCAFILVGWRDFITEDLAALCICFLVLAMQPTTSWGDTMIEVEVLMISPQRLMEYADMQPEGAFETDTPFEITHGKIKIQNLFMKYRDNYPFALHDLNITIEAGQKVGIVGRTGSGKSSIMNVLFRLVNPTFGTILIDGQDYINAGLHQLRRQMSVIPQSPIIFMATFRDNIDPFHEHTDEEILNICKQSDIYEVVQALPNKLDTMLSGRESSLSAGEKQLVCLARALIRNSKIVMMDEATANVDPKTDRIVHEKVKTMFSKNTMLIVAHRLRTIIDVDLIVVMEEGTCKEMGSPKELVAVENSLFRNLILHTGPQESKYLLEKLQNA